MGWRRPTGTAPPHPRQSLIDRFVLNTVRDERGVRVRPLRAGRRRAAMRGWARQGEFDRVRRLLVPRMVRFVVIGLVFVLFVSALFFLTSSWCLIPWLFLVYPSTWLLIAGGSLVLLLPWSIALQVCDDRAAVRAMLAKRMCLRCAYDLEGAPVDGAGVCVCPECGAAWGVSAGFSEGA